MKLALQLYSVREQMEKNFFGTLKKLKEMGYDGGELAGLYNHTPEEVRDMFAFLDFTPISAHVTYQDLMKDLEKTVSDYATIGCKYIAIPYLPEDYRYGTKNYQEVLDNIPKISACCKKYGIGLLYHNHDFEFEKTEKGTYVLDDLYTQYGKEIINTELDTCWVNVGGEEPCAFVRKYTGRAPVVHLKDFDGEKNENMYQLIGLKEEKKEQSKFEFRPLGYGRQNVPAIVEAAKDAGATWLIAEQDEPSMGKDRMECAKMSMDTMKKINY